MSVLATGKQKACCKGQCPGQNYAHDELLRTWFWLYAKTESAEKSRQGT